MSTTRSGYRARQNPFALLRKYYPRVRTRVVAPFLLVLIILAAVGVFTVTRLVAGSLQERFNAQLLASAAAAKNVSVDVETQLLADLRLLSFIDVVDEQINAGDSAALESTLRPLIANNTLDDVMVYNAEGTGLLRIRRSSGSRELAYEIITALPAASMPGLTRVLNDEHDIYGDKFIDLVEGASGYTFFISGPVTSNTGELVGAISIGIPIERLITLMTEQALSSIALYDENGALLDSSFRVSDPTPLILTPDTQTAVHTRLNQGESALFERVFGSTPYQVLYTNFELRSQSVGLLAVGLPTSFIVESAGSSRNLLILLFALTAFAVLTLGRLVARSITHPIQQLVGTTRAIIKGDLKRRVDLKTRDELGELGGTFNRMTEQLVQRNFEVDALLKLQIEETTRREAIISNIGDVVIVQNTDGDITLLNHAAQNLFDHLSSSPAEEQRLYSLIEQEAALDTPLMIELKGQHFSALSAPIRLRDNGVLGQVTVLRDFTALVEAEKLKDEMILQMSHELRTPLAVVRGNADLLRILEKNKFSDKGVTMFDRMVENVIVLERMINQVVDVSVVTAGRFSIDRQPVDLRSLVTEKGDCWEPLMAKRKLQFTLQVSEQSLMINGDGERLGDVLDHLLRNAHDYTLPGGRVILRAFPRGHEVIIDVRDTGVGVQEDEKDKVFDRMYRGTAAAAGPTDSRGLGVGLFLSKYIVEQHQGRIQLASQAGKGTQVRVWLPSHQEQHA